MAHKSPKSKLAANGLMEPWNGGFFDYWRGAHLNVKLGWGPNGSQCDSFVPIKSRPNGRAKEVRAKLTDDERRNLRVTVFETGFDIS